VTVNNDRAKAARELLAFYVEAGVDVCLGDVPADHVAIGDRRPDVPERPAPGILALPSSRPAPPRNETPLVAPNTAVMAARQAAKSAANLAELRRILETFEGCVLKQTAKKLVFADGNPQARVMFVGEAPGREEDLEGLPFVGRSGQLLDRMMAAIGLDRKSAYIANVIPWRPPGNRTPTPQEAAICLPFISRQVELSEADILVCLGGPSAQALLGVKEGILKTRGRWFPYLAGSREIRAIATLHPAYLLRQPLQKRLVWRDFLMVRKALDAAPA
jgi:uracil-DNA glycosylase